MSAMATMMLDTLAMSERLAHAGVEARQAKAIAALIGDAQIVGRDDLVTKSFLASELAVLRSEFRHEMRTLAAELKADMVRWLLGSQAALLLTIVGLAKAHLFG